MKRADHEKARGAMLKFLFWVLLLANGLLLAANLGYLDSWLSAAHEPGRIALQLNPDKIKLVPAATALAAASAAAVKKEVLTCVEIGNFEEAEAKQFEARLAGLPLGERVTRRILPDGERHIVYIPPQGGKEGADRKVAELRNLGVKDFFVIQDNSELRWGISLGIFKTEEAARAHVAAVGKKGVRSARLGMTGLPSSKVAFQLRRLDAAAKSGVEKIKSDFPNQELRACAPDQP